MVAGNRPRPKNVDASGHKPRTVFAPKPPPQQQAHGGCREYQNRNLQESAGAGGEGVRKGGNVEAAAPTTPTISQELVDVPALCSGDKCQNQSKTPAPRHDNTTTAVRVPEATRTTETVAEGCGGSRCIDLRLLLTGGCPYPGMEEALPRSGSAPSSSALAFSNPSGATSFFSCKLVDATSALTGGHSKDACSSPKSEEEKPSKTTRSCWEERRGATTVGVDSSSSPQNCQKCTGGGALGTSSVPEAKQQQSALKRPTAKKITSKSSRWRCPLSSALLPPLPSEQGISGNGVGKRKPGLLPLHRKKSDLVRNGFRGGGLYTHTRAAQSKIASAIHKSNLAKRNGNVPSVKTSDTSRPSTTTGLITDEGAPAGRVCPGNGAPAVLGADRGRLKARVRVIEWKRRQAEELKMKHEEQISLEQKRRAEADTETARRLAAVRVEEAERRLSLERENASDDIRAAEAAEKWATATRQRDRRRAEIYAINALMRAAFEKEFKAYCLERKECAAQETPSAPQDPSLKKDEKSPA